MGRTVGPWLLGLAILPALTARGESVAPTYLEVRRGLDALIADLPGRPAADRPVWERFRDGLERELAGYRRAANEPARREALARIERFRASLHSVSWERGVAVRDLLNAWLAPRKGVADASARLLDRVAKLREPAGETGRRDRWISLVDHRLGAALRGYEGAAGVAARLAALGELHVILNTLRAGNAAHPWPEGQALQEALENLCDGPNLDAAADASSLAAFLERDVVESGPMTYRGQQSNIVAGPRVGFSLLHSTSGIAFANAQKATTVTPIRGFQDQLAADDQGRRAASLYKFDATTRDESEVTIVALFTTNGVRLRPATTHKVEASVTAAPTGDPISGITREFVSLLGYGQREIEGQVHEGLMARLHREVPARANEISRIKAAEATDQLNAQLRPFLPGDGSIRTPPLPVTPKLTVGPIELAEADLQSRSDRAYVVGTIRWLDADRQRGADLPPPEHFRVAEPGAVLHVHVGSLLSNLAHGLFRTPSIHKVRDVLVIARTDKDKAPADPADGPPVRTVENPTNAAFLDAAKQIGEGRFVARIHRPDRAPEFATDAEGRIVVVVHDFQIDVPAPAPKGLVQLFGGHHPADDGPKIYRIAASDLEIGLRFVHEDGPDGVPRFSGQVETVDLGPNAIVAELKGGTDVEPAAPLIRAGALAAIQSRLKGQSFDVPLDRVQSPAGFVLDSISALDPSGWIRVVLVRD